MIFLTSKTILKKTSKKSIFFNKLKNRLLKKKRKFSLKGNKNLILVRAFVNKIRVKKN